MMGRDRATGPSFSLRRSRNPMKIGAFSLQTAEEWKMTDTLPKRLVIVAAPSPLAAIGEMLRKAFGNPAPMEIFDRLIAMLHRY